MAAELIVGITPLGHDLSMTVARRDGRVVLVAEEERYSGVKGGQFAFHPSRFTAVIEEAGFLLSDVAVFAPVGTPAASIHDGSGAVLYPPEARQRHLDAWIDAYKRLLPDAQHLPPIRHHRAHAASSYYTSTFDEAAVVTIDGHGDGECCTISHASGSRIRLLERQTVPDSVAYLFRATSTYLGFRGHEREGKLMALAAYGSPRNAVHVAAIFFDRATYPARATASVRAMPCRQDAWVARLAAELGPPRVPDSPLNSDHFDLAAAVQQILTEYMMSVLEHAHRVTGASSCAAAGGAFVNSVANGYARRNGPFRNLLLPAWASDAGLSVGAAAAALAEHGTRMVLTNAYLGSDLSVERVPDAAAALGLSCTAVNDPAAAAAELVADGKLVGWAQGRLELGPRALGNRSVLGNPALPRIRDELNARKHRETWRPFGASMLTSDGTESPYMNVTFDRLDEAAFRSALHVDGSCRVHTVSDAANPLFARLLHQMQTRTGVPAVINTSLNGRGQPIARTVEESLRTAMGLELDAIVIGPYLVTGCEKGSSAELSRAALTPLLPEPFDLVLPFHARAFPVPEWLENRATRIIELPALLRSPVPEIDEDDGLQAVVVYHPWFNAVLPEMLPRVLTWAKRRARTRRVVIVDRAGDTMDVRHDSLASGNDLDAAPPSDVEGHLLRVSARTGGANADSRDPWFPNE